MREIKVRILDGAWERLWRKCVEATDGNVIPTEMIEGYLNLMPEINEGEVIVLNTSTVIELMEERR